MIFPAFNHIVWHLNIFTKNTLSLARWFSWLECHSVHRKVMGPIPSQGTYLGCRFGPQLGLVWVATD